MGLTRIDTGEGEVFQMCTLSVAAGAPTPVPAGKPCPIHSSTQCVDTYRTSRNLARFTLRDFLRMRRRWRRESAEWQAAGATNGLRDTTPA